MDYRLPHVCMFIKHTTVVTEDNSRLLVDHEIMLIEVIRISWVL